MINNNSFVTDNYKNNNNKSSIENFEIVYYSNLAYHFKYHFLFVLTPIGLITNLICIIVFTRRNLNKTNMGFYCMCIAISNMITLLFYMFVTQSKFVLGIELETSSDIACKVIMLLRRTIRELSPAIESLLTIDRFLVVFYPNRFKWINKRRTILIAICAVYFFLVLVSIGNMLYFVANNSSSLSKKICTSSKWIVLSSDIISTVMRTFLPCSIMFIFNSLMIYRLFKSRTFFASHNRNLNREHEFTVTVMFINFSFQN